MRNPAFHAAAAWMALALAGLAPQGFAAGAGEAGAASRAVFDEVRKNFGDVYMTSSVSHRYILRNEGGSDLTLSVTTSCGCTVADYTQSVPPGGEGYIDLTMEGTHGFLEQSAIVTTNEPDGSNRHELYINATFMEHVEFVPSRSVSFEGPPLPAMQTLVLRNHAIDRTLFIVKSGLSASVRPYVAFRYEPVVSGKEYLLVLERIGDIPEGKRLRGNLRLEVAHPGQTPMVYSVEIRMFQKPGFAQERQKPRKSSRR